MRKIFTILFALLFVASIARASDPNCTVSGTVTTAENGTVFFVNTYTQNINGSVIPPTTYSGTVNSVGALTPTNIPQGLWVTIDVGSTTKPTQQVFTQIPIASTADIALLLSSGAAVGTPTATPTPSGGGGANVRVDQLISPAQGNYNMGGNRFTSLGAPANNGDSLEQGGPIKNSCIDNSCPVTNFGAKGDGITDDTNAINNAIAASCAQSGGRFPVTFPATPGAGFLISSPILMTCTTKLVGAGMTATNIKQNFVGPEIIAQGIDTGWKPPLTTNISAKWQASHAYTQYQDILDSNGNIEVVTSANCTSGTVHPSWPIAQPATVSDNTCTWTLGTTGGTLSIANGIGASLDLADPELFNGAGYGGNSGSFEMNYVSGLDEILNGLTHFTVEFYVEDFENDGGGSGYSDLFDISQGQPGSGFDGFSIRSGGNSCTAGFNCIGGDVDIGGSQVSIPNTGSSHMATGTIYHVAVTYDGTTVRTFIGGALVSSTAASGAWTINPYNSIQIGGNAPNVFPGANPFHSTMKAFVDSVRISNTARYTSAFTPPTAKFSWDSNTLFLENFPTNAPQGTIEGEKSVLGVETNTYFPVETTNGAQELNPAYIGNFNLNGMIVANWMLNSTIENIQNSAAGTGCIWLHDNDFQDVIKYAFCSVTPKSDITTVAYMFGNQANNNLYKNLRCDGEYTCITAFGGSGTYIEPDYTDRGEAIYPFFLDQAQAEFISPTTDIEDTSSRFGAAIYSLQSYAPVEIHGGQISSALSSGSYLQLFGGSPFSVTGTDFTNSAAQILNITSPPTGISLVNTFRDINYPATVNLVNSPTTNNIYTLLQNNGTFTGISPIFENGLLSAGTVSVGKPILSSVTANNNGSWNFGNGTASCQVNVPSTWLTGDTLIFKASVLNANNTLSCPTGFTAITGGSATDSSTAAVIACKRTASSEPGNYTISFTNGGVASCMIEDWRFVSSVGTASASIATAGASANAPVPSGTTSAQIISSYAQNQPTVTAPANESVNVNFNSTNGLTVGAIDAQYNGPALADTWTTNAGTPPKWAMVQVPLTYTSLNVSTGGQVIAAAGIVNGCKADVTLATGSGTFSNSCITTASACNAKDITTIANTCTVGIPTSGSVTVTGTGSDVCRTVCQ